MRNLFYSFKHVWIIFLVILFRLDQIPPTFTSSFLTPNKCYQHLDYGSRESDVDVKFEISRVNLGLVFDKPRRRHLEVMM